MKVTVLLKKVYEMGSHNINHFWHKNILKNLILYAPNKCPTLNMKAIGVAPYVVYTITLAITHRVSFLVLSYL